MYSFFLIIKYLIVLVCLWSFTNGETCGSYEDHFDCPGDNDPYDFTECCIQENMTKIYCCENPLHERSYRLVVSISISVILTCIILSVLIIVCCFWSKCPLFDLGWSKYSRRNGVIAYTKEEEALNEPPDENEYSRQYAPVNVKVSRVDEV